MRDRREHHGRRVRHGRRAHLRHRVHLRHCVHLRHHDHHGRHDHDPHGLYQQVGKLASVPLFLDGFLADRLDPRS